MKKERPLKQKSGSHPGKVLGVSQKDRPLFGDAVAVIELHKLVQGGEELVPHVVLTTAILQHLKMLHVIPVTVKLKKKGKDMFKIISTT